MTTIPASQIANVIPNVLAAGGNAINLNGLVLTRSQRIPIGTVQPFSSAPAVAAYFGATATISIDATIYFNGFQGATAIPGTLLAAQYNQTAVAAWLRGASTAALSLTALQAVNGTLTLTVDGYSRSGSVNLSGASSPSVAATTIQTALNASLPQQSTFTGSIGAQTTNFTGAINGNLLTITSIANGTVVVGGSVADGTAVIAGTQITGQLSGTTGSTGVYTVSVNQSVPSGTMNETYGLLNVVTVSGTLGVGQTVLGTVGGSGATTGTQITALGSATAGGTGTYIVNISQTVASLSSPSTTASAVTVTFDSLSGGYLITSGIFGPSSTIGFASGNVATALSLTQALGAINSQGANAVLPGVFMASLILQNMNWASFMTDFDPDGGSGNAIKLQFAQWVNTQNFNFVYVCWDTDITPTINNPATSSLGYLINTVFSLSGTCLIWHPDSTIAAFEMGIAASLNFNAINGRDTFKFRSQAGLVAAVTTQQVANFLGGNPLITGDRGNGYNFYGAFSSATTNFVFFANGFVSGPFLWLDSFYNQIWLNNNFELALIQFLTSIGSVPYNSAGQAMIENSVAGVITQAGQFGVFRSGVTLSASQTIAVNAAAAANIVAPLFAQGYYMQVLPAAPSVRQSRGTPPCNFFYCDGQSIQQLTLSSVSLL